MIEPADVQKAAKLFAEIVARKHERTARVFLFAKAVEIRRKADLRFDLFLAVTEIVVRDNRDNHAAFVARRELESHTVVVEFALVLPTHPIAALPLARAVPMRQADLFLRHQNEMRRENHATGVSSPMIDIEARVVLG